MLTLLDLGAEFWRNAQGGKEPTLGYDLTIERLIWYRDDSAGRLIVCADSPRSERKARVESYKSNREKKPEPAIDALRAVENRVLDWGVPLARVDGWEADDVIATLVEQSFPEPTRVIGSEKDFFCLLSEPHVTLVGKSGPLGPNHCYDKFGVSPSQMVDYLTLAGDSADGIPGCPNCGPGRAADLLERFGDIESIARGTDAELLKVRGIGKKTLESLRAFIGDNTTLTTPMSETRFLVTMRRDLPISLTELLAQQR